MGKITLRALAVLCPTGRCADRGPHDHRDRELAPGHVAELGRLVDELVHALEEKIGVLHVGDRPHPEHGRADSRASDGFFTDRRVDHPAVAELLHQAEVNTEGAAETALHPDVLPYEKNVRISAHFFGDGLPERFGDRQAASTSGRLGQSLSVRHRHLPVLPQGRGTASSWQTRRRRPVRP